MEKKRKYVAIDSDGNEVEFDFSVDLNEALSKKDDKGNPFYTLPSPSGVIAPDDFVEGKGKKKKKEGKEEE